MNENTLKNHRKVRIFGAIVLLSFFLSLSGIWATPVYADVFTPVETATLTGKPAVCTEDISQAVSWMNYYNLITLDDLEGVTHVDGFTYIGDDYEDTSLSDFNINPPYASCSQASVTVVGDIKYNTQMRAQRGDVLLGGNKYGTVMFNGGYGCNVVYDNTLSNAGIVSTFQNASQKLSQATPNNSALVEHGNQLNFYVNSVDANGLAVFNIAANNSFNLGSIAQIEIKGNHNAATTILINVSGSTVNWYNGNMVGMLTTDAGRQKVIWNFYEATTINTNKNFHGALLAPYATVDTNSVNLDGTVVVKTLRDAGEVHRPLFSLSNRDPLKNVCDDSPSPTRDLKVIKVDDDWDGLKNWEITLRRISPNPQTYDSDFTDRDGEAYFDDLPYGTYEICEVMQEEWEAIFNECETIELDGDTPQYPQTVRGMTLDSSLLDSDSVETYGWGGGKKTPTIIFKNRKVPTYELKVIKRNEQDERLPGWAITVTNTATSKVYGPIPTNGSGEAKFEKLPAGEYLVCETLQPGWMAITDVCQTITLGDRRTSEVQTSGMEDELTIQGGYHPPSTPTVTFKNQELGDLKVKKIVDWNDGTPTDQTFEICITGPSYPQQPNCQEVGPFDADGYKYLTWDNLIPGKYTVTETNPGAQWEVSESQDVWVKSGKTRYAEIENDYVVGRLKVKKLVEWNGVTPTDQTFEICITGPSYPQQPSCQDVGPFNADGYEYLVWDDLIPGDYTVTETNPGSQWDVTTPDDSVRVKRGKTADAFVKNEHLLGGLQVTKTVNWNGVTPTDQTFEICITGPSHPQNASCEEVGPNGGAVTWDNLIPGDYTVTETNPGSEWDVTVPTGAVAVASGQTANADVENEYVLGSLKVIKSVDWQGATPTGQTFEICVTGPSHPTPDCQSVGSSGGDVLWNDLIPGDYTVAETNPGSEWTVSVNGSPATVVSGQTAEVNVSNVYKLGSLQITKNVDWQGATPTNQTFEICVTGPSHPTSDCQSIGSTGGDLLWNNLIPGDYTVAETNPGSEWNVTVPVGAVAVASGQTANANVSNTYKATPGISIKKYTNGDDADTPTGPIVPVGSEVTWTYVVTNAGNVPLSNVTVTDDQGVIPVYVSGDDDNDTLLDVNETWVYTATGTAIEGQYANIGTATGTPPEGPNVSDDDPSHYFGATPGISIKKYTNGDDADMPTGPVVPVGSEVTWTYEVRNTGNVPLSNVTVTDDQGVTPVYVSGDVNGDNILALDEVWLYQAKGTAIEGQYANIGIVTGTPPVGSDVSDDDPSHYFGAAPGIAIKKYTNGDDADTPTGPVVPVGSEVTWTYEVRNTGNVPLSNVTVTDDQGVTPVYVSGDDNNDTILDQNEVWWYQAKGAAVAGQYKNIGTVTGTPPVGSNVTDDDPSHYYGETPAQEPASLGDRVWHDLNANGVQDQGEPGVSGVTVRLLTDNCTVQTGMSTTTDQNGIYGFGNLQPGNYCVEFDLSTLPAGYRVSPQNVGDDSTDSDAEASTGKTHSVELAAGEQNLTLDLGVYRLASLGDRVWEDTNKNGVQDAGEVNVQGVKVTLFNSNNQQVGDPTTTDVNGNYLFANLTPGSYYVVFSLESLPDGTTFTTANAAGVTDDLDSDPDATGKTPSVTLVSGQDYVDLDAGIVLPEQPPLLSELGDTVWFDTNKNGIQDEGEQGVPNVVVNLYIEGNPNVFKSTTTDANGKYLFTELEPNAYYVEFANVPGYSFTEYNVTTGDNSDALDSDPLVPQVAVGVVASAEDGVLGQPLTYTFFYTNTDSTDQATNVTLTTEVPEGTTFVADGGTNGWACSGTQAGSVCTLAVGNLPAGASGSATFVVHIDSVREAVPDPLTLHVEVTQETVARTAVVVLGAGESNMTIDAGLVRVEALQITPLATDPTGLPGTDQPEPPRRQAIFLPAVQS